jgi:hypothetical protein
MRRFSLIFSILFLLPYVVQSECLNRGYTVVFVNGIFTSKLEALKSTKVLDDKLNDEFNGEPVVVKLGYNPSHIAGLGDLAQAAIQGFAGTISTFDRDTILMQIHPEVTTRKIFFVGHSQGTFYTNDIYGYLLSHGEPKAAVGVYNVATPANYVAGGGKYLTSYADTIINNFYAEYARTTGALPPLSPNVDLDFGGALGNGHNFVNNYLAYGGERMVSDVQAGLTRLQAEEGSALEGCFTPPDKTLAYQAKEVFYAIADPAAIGVKDATITAANGVTAAINGIAGGLAAVGSFFAFAAEATPEPRTENLPGSFNVVKAIYGSSVTEEDLQDLVGTKQSGAVAIAVQRPPKASPPYIKESVPRAPSEVLGEQTEEPAAPLIPPPPAIIGGTPGFGGGGGPSTVPEPEAPVGPPEDTPVPADPVPVPPVEEEEEVEEEEVATTTPPAPPVENTLLVQSNVSALGQTQESQQGNFPVQQVGKNLSGTIGSVAYKVHSAAIASNLTEGWGSVHIFNCFSVDYTPIGFCQKVSTSSSLSIASQSGDNATLLATMSPYAFEPSNYYIIQFFTSGDMAMYGSPVRVMADPNSIGVWTPGPYFSSAYLDPGVADWGFRICDSATCSF